MPYVACLHYRRDSLAFHGLDDYSDVESHVYPECMLNVMM
jgi:hypothetical protein